MSTEANLLPDETPEVKPGNYSPVTVHVEDTMGAFFLGVLSVILLIGWRRAEARYQALLTQREMINRNHSLDT